MNDAKSQIKLFSMVAAILMVTATEIIVAYHYWTALSGFARVALVGLAVVAWVILWSTWWASKAGEEARVKYAAYVIAFGVSIVMIFNGAMVIADLTLNKRQEKADNGDVAKITARGKAIAELKKAGGNWRDIRELETGNRQAEGTAKLTEVTDEDVASYRWIKEYTSFWVFFVPFAVALVGKFALVGIIALPGGASTVLPPSGRPAPPSGPMGGGRSMESMLGGGPPRTGFTPPMPSSASRDRDGGILGGGSFPKD
jgi:hypothetical protein